MGINPLGQTEAWLSDVSVPCNYIVSGDLDGNCKVELIDFAMVAAHWLIDCIAEPENPECVPIP